MFTLINTLIPILAGSFLSVEVDKPPMSWECERLGRTGGSEAGYTPKTESNRAIKSYVEYFTIFRLGHPCIPTELIAWAFVEPRPASRSLKQLSEPLNGRTFSVLYEVAYHLHLGHAVR